MIDTYINCREKVIDNFPEDSIDKLVEPIDFKYTKVNLDQLFLLIKK